MTNENIPERKKKASILLVEDNRMDVELTLDAFQEARVDNEVYVVRTGEAALDYLLGRATYVDRARFPLPDFVLLDLKLPGISGLDVLKEVKQTSGISRIPVIVLTSSQEETDRIASYDYGVNSYLVKPISFESFLSVVGQICDYWLSLNVMAPMELDRPTEPPSSGSGQQASSKGAHHE